MVYTREMALICKEEKKLKICIIVHFMIFIWLVRLKFDSSDSLIEMFSILKKLFLKSLSQNVVAFIYAPSVLVNI